MLKRLLPIILILFFIQLATGGVPAKKYKSLGVTEDEHEVCATPCTLYSAFITNSAATRSYWRCYNLTAANTTPGTSVVAFDLELPIGSIHPKWDQGLRMTVGLTCIFVKGAADTDVAEVGANEVLAIYERK